MEFMVFLKGMLVGILASAPLGPVGLLCVNRTVQGGKSHGFISGLGAASADTFYAAIAAFGLSVISTFISDHEMAFRFGGALFLFLFGLWYIFRKNTTTPMPKSGPTYLAHYGSTLIFTLTNPITVLAFAAMFSLFGLRNHVDFKLTALIMVLGVFSGACLWWLMISFLSARFRDHLKHPNFNLINRVLGWFFVASGLGVVILLLVRYFR